MKDAYAKREELVMAFRNHSIPQEEVPHYYFGIKTDSGVTNRDHPEILHAINEYTDDCIFFSSLLCDDLTAHGRRLRAVYVKSFGKGAPEIAFADFSAGRASGTIPSESKYSEWLKGFPEY